ncbi:MAG: hypothetical protein AAFQ82_00360 [Myxococcota bacterium]
MKHALLLTMLLATLFCVACGNSPGERANNLIERSNALFTEICECSQELFEDNSLECIEDNTRDLEDEDCLDAAYGLNEEASDAVLDCANQVLSDFETCIDQSDTCSEQAVCIERAEDAEDLCPELPDAVRDELGDCD